MSAKKILEKIHKHGKKHGGNIEEVDSDLANLLDHPTIGKLHKLIDDGKKGKAGAQAAGDLQLLRTLVVIRGITDYVKDELGGATASELLQRTDAALDYAIEGTPIP